MTPTTSDSPFKAILPYRDVIHTTDSNGNHFGWVDLPSPEALQITGKRLAEYGARLCTITAFNKKKFAQDGDMQMVYNFDLDGAVLTVSIPVTPHDRRVPSLVDYFANADWHEREFAELFEIELTGRDAPKRLFLDPKIDTGVFNRLVPLSSMMNGASTKQLWETIFAETSMPDWAKEAK